MELPPPGGIRRGTPPAIINRTDFVDADANFLPPSPPYSGASTTSLKAIVPAIIGKRWTQQHGWYRPPVTVGGALRHDQLNEITDGLELG